MAPDTAIPSSGVEPTPEDEPKTLAELNQALIKETLAGYLEKAAKKRAKHLTTAVPPDPETGKSNCDIKSNIKSLPGVMTQRGCAYAGAKGVVWGPIKDVVHISHGPVGCGHYSWGQRRNYASGTAGVDNFVAMQVTSDYQEKDIVFGGDKKLTKMIDELNGLFPLNYGISIQSECPVGLIGDDIESVARIKSEELGKPIVPVRCEGFRGVSQSLGHHIANDTVRDYILPRERRDDGFEPGPYDVSIIGDYNIGGDCWSSRLLLEEMGLNVIAQWSGDTTVAELERPPLGKLNLIHCYRSMNYLARYMEEKFNIPWLEFNFFGPTQIAGSLRKIAAQFDETIQANAEKVIAKYQPMADAVIARYRPRLEGKRVLLYVGGLRPRHTVNAYSDLGMDVIGTGYEFAHKDDYQRTLEKVKEGTLIFDDATGYEIDEFIKSLRPDLVGSGIKEKYGIQKMGVPFRQMHSWDYSGPYHGYDGFAVFARDMDMAVNSPVWKLFDAPWKTAKADEAAA